MEKKIGMGGGGRGECPKNREVKCPKNFIRGVSSCDQAQCKS